MRLPTIALLRTPLLAITGAVCCVGLIVYTAQQLKSDQPAAAATPAISARTFVKGQRATVNAGLPVRLKIPKIGVDAAIEHVGLTPDGDLGAPKQPPNAAWYTPSPRPGDSGNAIIDGHFGYKNRVPAVFDNLHRLETGDNLYIKDKEGATVTFVVRKLKTYSADESTADVFHPRDGRAHLNLITCKGTWDKARKSYSARLVVFTDKAIE